MWISKGKYNQLVQDNERWMHDALLYDSIVQQLNRENTILFGENFTIVSNDIWKKIEADKKELDNKVKDLQALVDWYKNKYVELKILLEKN